MDAAQIQLEWWHIAIWWAALVLHFHIAVRWDCERNQSETSEFEG